MMKWITGMRNRIEHKVKFNQERKKLKSLMIYLMKNAYKFEEGNYSDLGFIAQRQNIENYEYNDLMCEKGMTIRHKSCKMYTIYVSANVNTKEVARVDFCEDLSIEPDVTLQILTKLNDELGLIVKNMKEFFKVERAKESADRAEALLRYSGKEVNDEKH